MSTLTYRSCPNAVDTAFELRRATAADLAFARELTCQNMLRYYIDHDLLWQDEAFDVAWAGRENWLIVRGDVSNRLFQSESGSSGTVHSRIASGTNLSGAGRRILGDRSGYRHEPPLPPTCVAPDGVQKQSGEKFVSEKRNAGTG